MYLLILLAFLITKTNGINSKFMEDDNMQMHPDIRSENFRLKNPNELTSEYWQNNAQKYLAHKIQQLNELNNKKAKNIIFFLGDGMSIHTTTAARVYLGGEEAELSFDKFPYLGLSKTYCVNKQVADSACSSTAYLCGVKGNYGTIGVNAQVERNNCTSAFLTNEKHATSIIKWAQDAGKSTGIVTTARVTHATPAGGYAHTSNRDWESDAEVVNSNCNPNITIDIARQLIESDVGQNLNVILGGGWRSFLPYTAFDPDGKNGRRLDGRNLINEWQHQHVNAKYVWNKLQLQGIDYSRIDNLMGIFATGHCLYNVEVENNGLHSTKPNLWDMTEAAIKILQKEKKGYFLFVEGALIDTAHHNNQARKAIDETAEFHYAIAKAQEITKNTDTLIVVTADHAHTLTYNGYPTRGNNILGSSNKKSGDGLEYTTLSYANGPGYYSTYQKNGTRIDISKLNYTNIDQAFMSAVPISSAAHGGEDVAIYAIGPHAHLFTGNYEQNNLPLLMAYAAKIGPYANSSAIVQKATVIILMVSIVMYIGVYFANN